MWQCLKPWPCSIRYRHHSYYYNFDCKCLCRTVAATAQMKRLDFSQSFHLSCCCNWHPEHNKHRHRTHNVNIEARLSNHCCSGKRKKYYIVWVYAACNAPYCRLWPVRLCHIFPRYITNLKSVFRFSLQLLSETLLILRRIERDIAHRKQQWHDSKTAILS